MATLLRSIAVTVDETTPGAFVWRLLEHTAGDWTPLDAAQGPSGSYSESMAAGLLALQALIDDLDAGPRDEGHTEAPPPRSDPLARPFGFGTLK